MALGTIPAVKWHIDFGNEHCERHGSQVNELTVVLDCPTNTVCIDYEFGCHGGVIMGDEDLLEAIDWLRHLKRNWSGYERRIDTIILGLQQHTN